MMVRRFFFWVLALFLMGPAGAKTDAQSLMPDTMGTVYIISGSTVAGAVLGLSTLSFVDKPSKNLKNIVIGGALGLIAGVIVSVSREASKEQKAYEQGASYVSWRQEALTISAAQKLSPKMGPAVLFHFPF